MKTRKAPKTRTKSGPQSAPGPAAPGAITTIHGAEIPLAELQHIAPAFRSFAIEIDTLRPDPNNAREHRDSDLGSTAASLKKFGQQESLQFDDSKTVRVGSGRLVAAKTLGWKWIAAIPSGLSGDQLKAFAIAHNRTAELSSWNALILEQQVQELADVDIDLGDVGLSADDLEELLAQANDDAETDEAEEKQFAPVGAETQPRLDQRKRIACPHCGKEFIPGQRDDT